MEAEISSDGALNFYQAAQCYIATYGIIHSRCWNHLKSRMENFLFAVSYYIMNLCLHTYN